MRRAQVSIALLLAACTSAAALLASGQTAAGTERTVYVVAVDAGGRAVTDLAPSDIQIRENGRDRQILHVGPSTARLKVALAVDELIAGNQAVRRTLLRFREQMRESADVALYLMGRANEKRVDYGTDIGVFLNAVQAFPVRPTYPGVLVESVFEIAKAQAALEGRRVIVLVAPEMPQASNMKANGPLDAVRDSGSVLYAVTVEGRTGSGGTLVENPASRLEGSDLTAIIERDIVIGDGPKQSGGLRLPTLNVEGFTPLFDRVADELHNQQVVRYLIPSGARADGRITISSRRRGVTVRGPNRVPAQ